MNRITSIMAMHSRDRGTWFLTPWGALGVVFAIGWLIALATDVLTKGTMGIFTGALAAFFIVAMLGGISTVTRTFPFAIGFCARRRDYLLGTLSMAIVVNAAWAILLTLLSLVEAKVIKGWGVGLHLFYLPFFSDGSPLRQFCWTTDAACAQADPNYLNGGAPGREVWAYFALLMFMYLLGLTLGSIFQRFGRTGEYIFSGIAFLLLSVFLLVSTYWGWWGAIFGWLAGQTAATLGLWLVLPTAFFALASFVLLRKATV